MQQPARVECCIGELVRTIGLPIMRRGRAKRGKPRVCAAKMKLWLGARVPSSLQVELLLRDLEGNSEANPVCFQRGQRVNTQHTA